MSFHRIKPILFNTEMVRAILDGRKTVTRRLPGKRIEDKWCEYDEYVSSVMPHDIPCVRCNEKAFYEQYPPYQIEDILYVRETWRPTVGKMHTISRDGERIVYTSDDHYGYEYKAHCFGVSDFYFPDGFKESEDYEHISEITSKGKWHPSIHMPKEAARIWLKVTDVRVERLQDITEDDVCKEGAEPLIRCAIEHETYNTDGTLGDMCWNTDECSYCPFIEKSYSELFGKMVWNSTIKKQDLDRYGWDANPWVWVIEFERIER